MKGKSDLHRSEGYALISSVVVAYFAVMLVFGVITVAAFEIRKTNRWKKSNEAHFLARAAMADAVYRLKADYTNVTNQLYVSAPLPLFPNDDLNTASYRYSMEPAGKVHFLGTQYMTGAFKVKAYGTRGNRKRGIETRIERDTFLRYSRFVQQTGLAYAANANIMGDLYAGANLDLRGNPIAFWGDVEVGGTIINQQWGTFHGDISGIGRGVDLVQSVNMNHYRDLAQGFLPGEGTGLYLASATSVDLNLFDFTGPTPSYNGNPLPVDFNGVVFCEGNISISGTLEGQSLTFFSAGNIIATGHIRTGNTMTGVSSTNPAMDFDAPSGVEQVMERNLDGIITPNTNVLKLRVSDAPWSRLRMELLENGVPIREADIMRAPGSPGDQAAIINNLQFDPSATYSARVHYYSNGNGANPAWVDACDGDPVNIGLVARNAFYVDGSTPRQLSIDAAILARDTSWYALGNWSSHPDGFDPGIWELTMTGPIITMRGGSAGPWSAYGSRYYKFDMDMVEHAPPFFPVPSDWWKLAYWWHLKEGEIIL